LLVHADFAAGRVNDVVRPAHSRLE
jgi:hypothetical protein